MQPFRSLASRAKNTFGYLQYRVAVELEFYRTYSPTYRYLCRVYRWWTYNFPEYVLPSPLPNPPGTRPQPPIWWIVPAEVLVQRIPVWEMKLHNLLLFGHTLPTTPEVEFRRSYLDWCKKIEAGQHEPLPVEAIERDAMSTHVPAYDYPFVHQQVYACVMARARAATGNVISRTTESEETQLPPWPSHWRNWHTVTDEHGLLTVVRPQQLELPTVTKTADGRQSIEDTGSTQHSAAQQKGAGGLLSDVESSEAMREARKEFVEAFKDASEMFKTGQVSASALVPRMIAFMQGRLETLRQALSKFMEGYTEGLKEVESGKVDLAEDAKGFYNRMMHTLPEFLESSDVDSIPQRLQSSMQALEAAKLSKAADQHRQNLEHAELPKSIEQQHPTAATSSSAAGTSDTAAASCKHSLESPKAAAGSTQNCPDLRLEDAAVPVEASDGEQTQSARSQLQTQEDGNRPCWNAAIPAHANTFAESSQDTLRSHKIDSKVKPGSGASHGDASEVSQANVQNTSGTQAGPSPSEQESNRSKEGGK